MKTYLREKAESLRLLLASTEGEITERIEKLSKELQVELNSEIEALLSTVDDLRRLAETREKTAQEYTLLKSLFEERTKR